MVTAMVFGLIDSLWKYMVRFDINPLGFVTIYEKIPLAKSSLLWIPWVVLFFLLGLFTYRERSNF